MIIIGWIGMGPDPDDSAFWAYRSDAPGSGFNFVSYYNEEVDRLLFEARSLPGCSTEERGDKYKRIQELIHEDVPYAFFYNPLSTMVWNTRVQGVKPGPWGFVYNVHRWYLTP
jgi:peptide/nickel transport system substrate-binding protein